jgi:hypothetical protein
MIKPTEEDVVVRSDCNERLCQVGVTILIRSEDTVNMHAFMLNGIILLLGSMAVGGDVCLL